MYYGSFFFFFSYVSVSYFTFILGILGTLGTRSLLRVVVPGLRDEGTSVPDSGVLFKTLPSSVGAVRVDGTSDSSDSTYSGNR